MATILVVDDLPANREVLIALLGHQGHRLIEAADGRQALTAARAEHPDLVITDVLMPTMDGYELVRQLRLDPSTSGIPVVFYTAHYGEREARALALSSGVADVLTKPVDSQEVLTIVGRVLAGDWKPANQGDTVPLPTEFDREHLRLLTDKLSAKAADVRTANARLRALINIGLELASERDAERLLQNVCVAARDLFGATYITLGIVSRNGQVERLITRGVVGGDWIKSGDAVPGILATVVAKGRPQRGVNPGGDPATLRLPALHPRIQSFLVAPIASPNQVYGWMLLVGHEGRTFTDEDEQLALALAGQVGRIYENGYLYAVAQAERNRAQRFLDTAEVILLALDTDGRITLVNRYACVVLGWTAEELIGRDWVDTCVPERMRVAIRKRLRERFAGNLSIGENPVLTRFGEERLIEWRNTLLRDEGGTTIGTLSSGTDITDRTRAEAALHETQEQLNFALQRSHTGGWDLDLLDQTAHRTIEHDRIFGYESLLPEWTYQMFLEHVLPEDRAEVDRLFQQAVATQTDWAFECRIRRADGQVRWIWAAGGHRADADGRPRHVSGIVQDITERKRVEEEVRHRARLASLGAAVGLAMTGADSLRAALQQCAEAFVVHLGAALARIWTLNERDGVLELQASAGLYTQLDGPHGKIPVGQLKIGRIARNRRPHLTNAVVDDPDATDQEWVRREGMVAFAGHPLIVNDRIVGVMAIFARSALSDAVMSGLASIADHIALGIERHTGAEALKAAEERMRFVLQNAGVGIWDQDYATGVLRCSETVETHYGLQPGTFSGTFEAFVDLTHPDDRASVREILGEAMKSGKDFSVQYRVIWPDGSVRWLSGSGRVLLGQHGEPVRAVGITQDVTERRTLEDQYQQAQKMEAVGRLAGGVAHDFNNLLTAILGYCGLLLADMAEHDPRRPDITEIQKAGTRAAGLTRQLLAFSRKEIIEPTLLDLHAVVADMRALLARLIGEDVKVMLGAPSAIGLVKADRGQVEQIVMNLAVNARDAMPRGGTLTIEAANVELDEHYARTHLSLKPGPYVVLTVTDTGTGMSPDVQARLFEPFFTTKEVGKGTGLGLATVHGIAARSGGAVHVYSEVGLGTSFKVYFPRAEVAEAAADARPAVAAAKAGGQTVLVVEDEAGLRELTRRMLDKQGYKVLVAGNADEALRLFDENLAIDVLLTDVVMPGLSGPELTRRLVGQRPGLKVIFMSGYTDEAIVNHGVLAPGIAFLNKPFTAESLGRKIRDAIEHQS